MPVQPQKRAASAARQKQSSFGFSRGLIPWSFDMHRGTRISFTLSSLRRSYNFDNTNDQTGAEALNTCHPGGRLKPPSSTIAPAFFSGLFGPAHFLHSPGMLAPEE